jgi:tetratricopeptide (TPR) repeat protein
VSEPTPLESPHAEHEQTIVPVRPDLATFETVAAPPSRRRASRWPWVALAVVLLAGAVGVFVLLPRWVDNGPSAPAAATPVASAPAEPAAPKLSPEQIAALKAQAESLLAALLPQQQKLTAQHPDGWGGEQWKRYSELGRNGDDAYLANSFQDAIQAYTEAAALGEQLLKLSAEIEKSALAAGRDAYAAGNAELATKQFDVVLGINPDNAAAKAGLAAAKKLPQVLELVRNGDAARTAGRLKEAAEDYRGALAIDPSWPAARNALDDVIQSIKSNEFADLMSAGQNALAEQDFNAAADQFHAALKVRPQSKEAQDGLTEAEQGLKLDKISLTEARALAFERRELWDRAIEQYQAALKIDPTLAFAQTGLERARARQGLEAKLVNLIDNPRLLFGDSVLKSAQALLEEAQAQPDAGERLKGQIEQLGALIKAATTPVTVTLHSDAMTEVTLYRVGALGTFAEKTVELRPGVYTAVGSRDGYRDVRQTFTVLPGRETPAVRVVCVEPI